MIREHLGAGNGKAIAGDEDVQNFQGLERRVVERSAVFRSDFKSYSREWAGTPNPSALLRPGPTMLLRRFW